MFCNPVWPLRGRHIDTTQALTHQTPLFTPCIARLVIHRWLWDDEVGHYIARNVTARAAPVLNRVHLMGMPLWAGMATAKVRLVAIETATVKRE